MAEAQAERDQEIRELAHRLWEQAGCPDGRDRDFWLEAERIVQGKDPAEATRERQDGSKTRRKNQ